MRRLGVLLFISIVFLQAGSAQDTNLHKIEATFIANFFRYIQWPNVTEGQDFVVGVYSKNQAITESLKAKFANQSFFGCKVVVTEVSDVADISKCKLLFVPSGRTSVLRKAFADQNSQPVLVITEESGAMPAESVINFKVIDSKLTFSVNKELAESKNIQISSKLLSMAK